MKEDKEGLLISLEGPDGCGKSTQAKLLVKWLKSEGYEAKITREPTDSPLGKTLRDSLNGKIDLSIEAEALLFASDRAQHVKDTIKPSLEKGEIVVTERYLHSSLAYQPSRGLPLDWVKEINKYAIKSDLTIFIDIPIEIGYERTNSEGKSDVFESDLELQKKVREAYKELAKEEDMPIIDGTKTKEKVRRRIIEEVKKLLHTDFSR